MFSKLIPGSVAAGSGPRQSRTTGDLKKAAIACLPPSFRSARHSVVEASNPKRPPTFSTGYAETETRPGARIESADGRSYAVDGDGALRRLVSNRDRSRPEASPTERAARQRHKERAEDQLEASDQARKRRRLKRAQESAARTQERAKRLVAKAQAILADQP